MSGEPAYRLRRSARYRTVLGEGLALDQASARLHVLNPAGAAVLEALAAGPRTPSELAGILSRRFEVEPERALEDVVAFLREAETAGLVEPVTGGTSPRE